MQILTGEIFVVSELEFNSDSTNFRYKKKDSISGVYGMIHKVK